MFETAELGQEITKQEYLEREPVLREELLGAQFALREAGFPVIVLLNGVDGAGKSETANLLNEWMDARLILTRAYDDPATEETERPLFWRYWRDLPPAGRMGIFLKAWYSEPFIRRVRGETSHEAFSASLSRIMGFEETLALDGAVVLKFWLHLGKKQQKRRFQSLAADPRTAWRVTRTDWQQWKRFDDFIPVAEHLLMRTSTGWAPWEIVEGTDARFRNLEIGASLLKGIRRGLAEAERRKGEAQALTFKGKGKRKADLGLPPELDLGTGGEGAYPAGTILSSLDMTRTLPKAKYQKEVDLLQGRLNALQREARERRTSMILLFEGWDAAGKGGAIRRVIQPLDARYYQVISVAAPTDEERAHHYLWRFWRHMPRAGRVTIFDRSWYGRVLVERVERFATPREWMRAYGEINHFEGELLEHGMGLLKFWIHITPEEQEGRFRARSQSPLKSWKLTAEDWRNRERWGAYERAVNDMVEHTSTRLAPWTLIEGNDKRYARVRVLQEVCRRFEEVLDGKLGSRPGARARKRGHAGRAGR